MIVLVHPKSYLPQNPILNLSQQLYILINFIYSLPILHLK